MIKTIFLAFENHSELASHFSKLFPKAEIVKGYINGESINPSFDEVNLGIGKHAFAIKIRYDSDDYDLKDLYSAYLSFLTSKNINLLRNEKAYQYRLGIYYIDMLDGIEADLFLNENVGKKTAIEIKMMRNFYPA